MQLIQTGQKTVIPLYKEEHAHKEVCIAYCSKSNDSEVSAATASQSLGFAFQPYMHV